MWSWPTVVLAKRRIVEQHLIDIDVKISSAQIRPLYHGFSVGWTETKRFFEPDRMSIPTKIWDTGWGLQIVKRDEEQKKLAPWVINKKLKGDKRRSFLPMRTKSIDFNVAPWIAQDPVEMEDKDGDGVAEKLSRILLRLGQDRHSLKVLRKHIILNRSFLRRRSNFERRNWSI